MATYHVDDDVLVSEYLKTVHFCMKDESWGKLAGKLIVKAFDHGLITMTAFDIWATLRAVPGHGISTKDTFAALSVSANSFGVIEEKT